MNYGYSYRHDSLKELCKSSNGSNMVKKNTLVLSIIHSAKRGESMISDDFSTIKTELTLKCTI